MNEDRLKLELQEARKEAAQWKAIAEMQSDLVAHKFAYDISKDVLPVSDGCVCKDSNVWWKSEDGPEFVHAGNETEWLNIRGFPEAYSVKEPRYTVTYLD